MNFRQMNRNIFSGDPVPHVLFQPRIEPWFDWHRIFECMPERYQDHTLQEFFDDLGISMRYVDYYTGMPHPIERELIPPARVREELEQGRGHRIYETPHGNLVETLKRTPDQTWRTVGFAVRDRDDLLVLRWLYEHTRYHFSLAAFDQGDRFIGERGVPQFYLPKSPYQALAQTWMTLPNLIYALADHRADVEATMQAIDDSYDGLYEEIIAAGRAQILNFGENIHEQLLSPRYFERYLIPFYEKRSGQLRQAGIYTHIHIDGYFRTLLPYLKDLPFDGYEALTPLPQGDVTPAEIADHIGDKVLLDGIPAIMFMRTFSEEALMTIVEELVSLFHPRLVLGVSDEVPEGTDVEAVERVRRIADWCRQQTA